jgi:phosphohistidine swiveling domain-containing protein
MLRLRGKPFGGQVALGTASILRAPNGIPLLPARLVSQLAKAPRDAAIEPVEVVIVARDYDAASSLMLPWAHVVGIVAEYAQEDAIRLGVPTVVGIEGVLDKIEDDALVLIDGERGIVLVDPDGMAVAAYQAEREKIAPRRRIFLDYAHQPAMTLDGREIRVLGRAGTLDEVRQALESGADVLYVPQESPLLSDQEDDEAHLEALLNLAEAAAGKPITLEWDIQTVAASNILRAALRAEFTVVFPVTESAETVTDVNSYLQETREELLSEDVDFADVRLAGSVAIADELPIELADIFVNKIVVNGIDQDTLQSTDTQAWISRLTDSARYVLMPVEVNMPQVEAEPLRTALGLGVSGVIVDAADVPQVKELIRTIDATAVRESILQNSSGEG